MFMLKFKDSFPKFNELKRNLSLLYVSEKQVPRIMIVLKFTLISPLLKKAENYLITFSRK